MWSEERHATLGRLWAEGKSATEIAKELACGFSRSAILGKVHRLGLPPRISAPHPPKSTKWCKPQRVKRIKPRAPKVRAAKPPPPPKPARPTVVFSDDPASRIAAALIASADAAQRRRDGFRATERTR